MKTPAPAATLGLMRYDAMCTAIAACERVDEVKEIRDRARAFECYAKQALNIEAERKAGEIRLRAERHAGRLLKEMKQTGQRANVADGASSRVGRLDKPSLADLGVTKDQSSDWQRLAEIPEADFEAELKKPGTKPSTEGLLHKLNPTPPPEPLRIDTKTIRAWGWVKDFEHEKLPDTLPADLWEDMPDWMQEDVAKRAPQLIAWLQAFEGLTICQRKRPNSRRNESTT